MRVISGKWRGRALKAPAGEATRPTSDRAREAIFSMLASRIGTFEGLDVLDLFAGTGALGIEALSRGAGSCCFIDNDATAVRAIKANLAALGAGAATGIVFTGVTPASLADAITRTIGLYRQPALWKGLQRAGMKADFSWGASGAVYAKTYQELVRPA